MTPLDLARFAEHAYTDGHAKFRDDIDHEFWIDHHGTNGYCCTVGDVAVIAFRGTDSLDDWLHTNFRVEMVECGLGMSHKGFVNAARGVLQDVLYFLNATKPKHIHLVGHSLGGALAVITAQRLLGQAIPADMMTVTTFGCPRIGDETFVRTLGILSILQFIRRGDPVPDMPPTSLGYCHASMWQHFTRQDVQLDALTEGHSMTQYRRDFE